MSAKHSRLALFLAHFSGDWYEIGYGDEAIQAEHHEATF